MDTRRHQHLQHDECIAKKSAPQCASAVTPATFAAEAPAIHVDRTAHPLTKDLVQDDEVILLLLRPSLLYIVLSSLGGVLFIAFITFVLAYLARLPWVNWSDGQAFLLGLGLLALRLGWQTLEWTFKVYILTDRRVIARSGVLHVVVFQSQLKNIQHTTVFANLRERFCGLGTIGFATAGSDTFEAFWLMVRHPYSLHRTIVDAIQRYGR